MRSLNDKAAVLLFVVAAASGQHFASDRSCDFTGFDAETAVSRFLAKMPKESEIGPQDFRTIIPGFELGGFEVRGLNLLRQFGPAIPYCVNGSRMLEVELINNGDIVLMAPWKMCPGKEGSIRVSTDVSRFTVQLGLVESVSGIAEVLQYRDYAPSATEQLSLRVLGAGHMVMVVTEVLSKIFSGALREAWNSAFFRAFYIAVN